MGNEYDEVKIGVIGAFSALTGLLGVLAIPVYILVCANMTDYITALLAAPSRGMKRSSKIGITGIVKKIGMWFLIFAGFLLDQLIAYTSSAVGITLPFSFLIASIVTIWLCVNELVSILENLSDTLGDDMPKFLLPLVKSIRSQVEHKIEMEQQEK